MSVVELQANVREQAIPASFPRCTPRFQVGGGCVGVGAENDVQGGVLRALYLGGAVNVGRRFNRSQVRRAKLQRIETNPSDRENGDRWREDHRTV